ncbi:MAG: hypothetical protein ACP5VE_15330, partial [Chthonomonadales bacterium]
CARTGLQSRNRQARNAAVSPHSLRECPGSEARHEGGRILRRDKSGKAATLAMPASGRMLGHRS